MLRVGQKEVDAIAEVLLSGQIFRYHRAGKCERFERRYAKYLGVEHCIMTSSGTSALTAAMVGLGIGPGDEVIIPACTYMATAVAVLAAGAIPVIVDIDESITIDPKAVDAAAGPHTRAVVPVHMWGLPCDLDAVTRVARKHDLLVVEDACQCVGGGYKGRKVGSVGHAAGFSFNYYKNMTAGEGGAVVTDDDEAARRAFCMIDCCNYYWTGREEDFRPFIANGARATEIMGAMLNVQLDRIDPLIRRCRKQKHRILRETADTGLEPIPLHSPDDECGTHVMYALPSAEQADAFAQAVGGTVAGKTGRHVYTEWDQLFTHQGAPHPALNPYNLPENKPCRMDYTKDMCSRSLDILSRTVMIGTDPDRKRPDVTAAIRTIRQAAKDVLH